jgi:hypothetical protein
MECVPAADESQGMFHNCPLLDRTLVSGWLLTAALRQRLFDDVDDEYATDATTEDEVDDDDDEEIAEDEDENN